MVRPLPASAEAKSVRLQWDRAQPVAVFPSDTTERGGKHIGDRIDVPVFGLVGLGEQSRAQAW